MISAYTQGVISYQPRFLVWYVLRTAARSYSTSYFSVISDKTLLFLAQIQQVVTKVYGPARPSAVRTIMYSHMQNMPYSRIAAVPVVAVRSSHSITPKFTRTYPPPARNTIYTRTEYTTAVQTVSSVQLEDQLVLYSLAEAHAHTWYMTNVLYEYL